jgi:hypothetical protein
MSASRIRKSSLARTSNGTRRFVELLTLCERLIDSPAGDPVVPGTDWLPDAQHLALKFVKHLIAVRMLTGGSATSGANEGPQFVDHSSVNLLARAAIETYLTFAYIFCVTEDAVRQIRYKIWVMGGLMDRQRFEPTTDAGKAKIQSEGSKIQELRTDIEASPLFLALPPEERKAVQKGKWRGTKSWKRVAVEVGYSEAYFDRAYSYLCSYAHSSYLSVLQMGQALDQQTQRMLMNTILDAASLTMARFVPQYIRLFRRAEDILRAHPAHARLARLWHFNDVDFQRVWG